MFIRKCLKISTFSQRFGDHKHGSYRRNISVKLPFYRLRQSRYRQQTHYRLLPKLLPPYGVTAEKFPPKFCFTASAKVLRPKIVFPPAAKTNTAAWQYRRKPVRRKNHSRVNP
ncbi:unnamed protein product [Ectocarpus sp. 8 AP-2014]